MSSPVNRYDQLRHQAYLRFRTRDYDDPSTAKRKKYWGDYKNEIAGLPVEIRQSGMLATLAMRLAKDSNSVVLEDLKWSIGRDAMLLTEWVEEIHRIPFTAERMRRQSHLMHAAQALKLVAGMREAVARAELESEVQKLAGRSDTETDDEAEVAEEGDWLDDHPQNDDLETEGPE
jgi:hypothetical protein